MCLVGMPPLSGKILAHFVSFDGMLGTVDEVLLLPPVELATTLVGGVFDG